MVTRREIRQGYSEKSLIFLETLGENAGEYLKFPLPSRHMKTAVIYARVSSVNDRQSTRRQVAGLTEYATRNNFQVLQIYEEHISGEKKNDERPVLLDCLTYCRSNSVDCILLSELSRLGRNVYAVLENVHYCIDNHINIFFQKESLSLFQDNGTPNPFLTIFVSVLGTCAQIERENIQFRLNSGRQQYLAPGGKVGRKA